MDPIILFPGSRLPLRTLSGLIEELTPAGSAEVVRTVNGRPILLAMPYGRLWSVRLSSDGDGKSTPPIDDLHIGDTLEFWSTKSFGRILEPGQTSCLLDRDPVDGSLHGRDVETGAPIDVSLAGRTVTIFGRAGWTEVSYRPRLVCMVSAIGTLGSDVTGRRQSSVIELEEFPA